MSLRNMAIGMAIIFSGLCLMNAQTVAAAPQEMAGVVTEEKTELKNGLAETPIKQQTIKSIAKVKVDGKYGYINEQGQWIIPAVLSEGEFWATEGVVVGKKEGLWGCFDTNGKIRIPFIFDKVGELHDGLLPVKKDGKWGYYNKEGQEIVARQYEEAGVFSEGLAAVKQNGRIGYIDQSGKVVIPFQFQESGDFHGGMAPVKVSGK